MTQSALSQELQRVRADGHADYSSHARAAGQAPGTVAPLAKVQRGGYAGYRGHAGGRVGATFNAEAHEVPIGRELGERFERLSLKTGGHRWRLSETESWLLNWADGGRGS